MLCSTYNTALVRCFISGAKLHQTVIKSLTLPKNYYLGLKLFLLLHISGNKQLSQSGLAALQIYLPNKTIAW